VNESELTEAEQYERWAEAEMRALRERLATERALRAAAELRADRAERELRAAMVRTDAASKAWRDVVGEVAK
jgi:uncharacterized protein (DUF2267 family)